MHLARQPNIIKRMAHRINATKKIEARNTKAVQVLLILKAKRKVMLPPQTEIRMGKLKEVPKPNMRS